MWTLIRRPSPGPRAGPAPPAPPGRPRRRLPAPVATPPTGPIDVGRSSGRGLLWAVIAAVVIGAGIFVLPSSREESTPVASDTLVGTWHQRDAGTSNIFYFVDAAVGGVYPIVLYDDFTSSGICGDNGPMLWAGFVEETASNSFEGSFGTYWCPDNGDGVREDPFGLGVVTKASLLAIVLGRGGDHSRPVACGASRGTLAMRFAPNGVLSTYRQRSIPGIGGRRDSVTGSGSV